MKITVTGKGGVGKTSFAATLARVFAAEGRNVLAADADPDADLGLALELGVSQVRVVASKVRDEQDEQFIREKIPEEDLLGFIHYNPDILKADRSGASPYDHNPALVSEVKEIRKKMEA